jgi:hypothetical protein
MDDSQARILLSAERARVEELLSDLRRNRRADRSAVGEQGDMSDPAESFVTEGTDDAIALGMTRRLEAIETRRWHVRSFSRKWRAHSRRTARSRSRRRAHGGRSTRTHVGIGSTTLDYRTLS